MNDTSEYSYCSWCFDKTEHKLIERNITIRNIYRCSECGNRTVMCRACKNMAKGGKWDDELCAEHDGTIGSFSRLTMQIGDITDYKKLMKRDSINIKKTGTIAALTLGGVAAIGPLAFAAAPVIGGTVGVTLFGLSGAAATSAGLAAIGGGSLAAGGLGMAGGAAIIGATGAALGGSLGGVVSYSYFSEVKGFSIELMKQGAEPGIICIDGFLTEKKVEPTDWKAALSEIYPNNAWYYVRWESKRLYDIGKTIAGAGGKAAAQKIIAGWAKRAAKNASKRLGPLGYVLSALDVAANPWSIAMTKAGQTGILLADILARTNSQYILCGHSLGARVIYYALENLSTKHNSKFVQEAHLLGGAVGNHEKDWANASRATVNGVKNYYTPNDWVLATFYKAGSFFCSVPVGRNPIKANGCSITNYDVSNFVGGHTAFKDSFHKYAVV